MTSHRPEPAAGLLVLVALYTLPVIVALQPGLDEDAWWHLRAGQWIVEHQAVPATDPFSRHGLETSQPWVAYSWLFEVLLYGLHHALGLGGLILYRAVLALLIVGAIHRLVARRESRPGVVVFLTGLAVLALLPLLSERPWLLSILFTTLTLDAVLALRSGRASWSVWLLPLIFVVWANVHVQFLYGLFVLGLACAAPLLDRGLGLTQTIETAPAGSRAWWRLVVLTGLCLAATVVNPYHLQVYEVICSYATQKAGCQHVTEMQALPFRTLADWSVLAAAGVAVFTLGRRARLSSFEVLLLAAAAWLAFRSQRDAWFIAVAAAGIAAGGRARSAHLAPPALGRQVLAGLGAAVLGGMVLWGLGDPAGRVREQLRVRYPVEAADFVKQQGWPGPLYNDYNWGGYLMWQLPALPVAMDGRANIHGEERLERTAATWRGRPGWDADPDLCAARVVIAEARSPLAALLRLDPRFELAYQDPVAVVFVSRTGTE